MLLLAFVCETPLSAIMSRFSEKETAEIDRIWRTLPTDHMWSGWAAVDRRPKTIWLYRRRNNWRRFELVKRGEGYALVDEQGARLGASNSLIKVLCEIETAPSLPVD